MFMGPPRLNHLAFCNVHGIVPIEPVSLLQCSRDRPDWTTEPFGMFMGPPRLNHLSFCNVYGTAPIEPLSILQCSWDRPNWTIQPFAMFMRPPWLNRLAFRNVHGTAPRSCFVGHSQAANRRGTEVKRANTRERNAKGKKRLGGTICT